MAGIAVIGAGMGALAAAARLAVAGHRVTVYERTDTYGGAVRRFEKDGFGFDTGPGLLPLPAVWRDLFVKTGKEPLEACVELVQVDPSARHVFADGTEAALPNASRAGVVSALDEALSDPAQAPHATTRATTASHLFTSLTRPPACSLFALFTLPPSTHCVRSTTDLCAIPCVCPYRLLKCQIAAEQGYADLGLPYWGKLVGGVS